jgi:hypothetical protein
MNTLDNPTKALEVKNMPGKGNKKGLGPKETPEQMLERLEKKLQDKGLPAAAKVIIQQQIDDLKGVERKASPEEERNAAMALAAEAAAAAQGAAGGGGGDDARREDILAALAFVKEVEREAAEVVAAAAAAAKAAYKVVKDKSDALTSAQRSKIRAITFSVEYGPLGRQSAESMKHDEAERALERARTWAKETVEKAQADVDAVRAGKPYAAVLEEREAVRRQSEQPAKTPEELAAEKLAYRKAMAEFAAERERDASDLKAATVWQAATRLGPRPSVLDYDSKLLSAYRTAMAAAAAAAPSGSSAE